jgi:hypothetical protein
MDQIDLEPTAIIDSDSKPIDLFSGPQWLTKIGDEYDYLLLSVCENAKNDISFDEAQEGGNQGSIHYQ